MDAGYEFGTSNMIKKKKVGTGDCRVFLKDPDC